MIRATTEPQLGHGAAAHHGGNSLLTENEIIRQLLGEKEKENASIRRQIKLMKKLREARTSDAHTVSFTLHRSDIPSPHTRVNLAYVARPPQLHQRLSSTFSKTQ